VLSEPPSRVPATINHDPTFAPIAPERRTVRPPATGSPVAERCVAVHAAVRRANCARRCAARSRESSACTRRASRWAATRSAIAHSCITALTSTLSRSPLESVCEFNP